MKLTKIFESKKGRKIELCFSCFEQEKENSEKQKIDFKTLLDTKLEALKLLNL